MIVVGTAGHIDHGKSSIVKRLTGTDPDHLPEEKKRGMTIDLGFAFLKTSNNDTIALVDVPGHERFVKNMIAGAGGIDAVMLVVAADDGWMPQSEEHFQIVRLLGVRSGLIVINKSDLCDEQRLKYLRQELKLKMANSFLSEAPILSISAATGAGFSELIQQLEILNAEIDSRRDIGKARLYIDRVFLQPGIGAVVTGTLQDGSFRSGQSICIWPSLGKAKIRTLQSNNADLEIACSGQRTAVSLTGVGKEKLERGGALVAEMELQYFKEHPVLALKLELLKHSTVTIVNRRRVLLLVGTSEMEGEVRILNKVEIIPGESGVVLFKPDRPLYALIGDHFILRLPTPMVTLGGGVILDHLKELPRQKDAKALNYLESRNVCDINQLIISELHKSIAVKKDELLRYSVYSQKETVEGLAAMIQADQVRVLESYAYEKKTLEELSIKVLDLVTEAVEQKNGLRTLTLNEIAILARINAKSTEFVLKVLISKKKLQLVDERYALAGESEKVPPEVLLAYKQILAELRANPFTPPAIEALISQGKFFKEAIGVLLKSGEVHKCGSEFLFLKSAWQEITAFIRSTLQIHNELKIGELRDKFGISRKYAIPTLEETDRLKLTKRQGDLRIKGEAFEIQKINS